MSYVCIEINWKSCSCIVPDKKVRNIIFIEEACSWYSEERKNFKMTGKKWLTGINWNGVNQSRMEHKDMQKRGIK